jgi:hypothetical protein
MPRRPLLLSVLLGCLVAAAATAQDSVATGTPGESVIVWRLSDDGDWLAAVPSSDAPAAGPELLLAPLLPQPYALGAQATAGIAGAVAINLGSGNQVALGGERRVWLSAANPGAAPPWCDGLSPLMSMSGLPNDCLAPSAGSDPFPRLTRDQAILSMSTPALELGLTYGVSEGTPWEARGTPSALWMADDRALFDPGSRLLWIGTGPGQDLALTGTWRIAPNAALDVGAGVGQWSVYPTPGALPLEFDQAALRLGMSYGAFSGGIIGRVVRPAGGTAQGQFSGLDLAVSWRTPWEGELSFGARNLLSRGSDSLLPDPSAATLDEATARTPYVRYRQDL